jgi:glycosyltransferase involved in cell wall biosynthesis
MKIVFSAVAPENFYISKTIQKIEELGHSVIIYNYKRNREVNYRFVNKHFQMYEDLLNFAEEIEADLIYIQDYLAVPEFLLYELKTRPNYKPKILFAFQLREPNRSIARATALKDLIDMPQIARAITFNMSFGKKSLPYNIELAGVNLEKLKPIPEPFNENPEEFNITKEEARKKFNVPLNKFIVLHSGRWIYVKGSDIFANSIREINKWGLGDDMVFLIHINPVEKDLDRTIIEELKQENNVIIKEETLDKGQMSKLYLTSDLVVCGHRKVYEYSQSGIPIMAALAGSLIVSPNFSYFDDIINTYRTGTTYETENYEDLAEKILLTKTKYSDIIKLANFKDLIKTYIPYYDIAKFALENLEV